MCVCVSKQQILLYYDIQILFGEYEPGLANPNTEGFSVQWKLPEDYKYYLQKFPVSIKCNP